MAIIFPSNSTHTLQQATIYMQLGQTELALDGFLEYFGKNPATVAASEMGQRGVTQILYCHHQLGNHEAVVNWMAHSTSQSAERVAHEAIAALSLVSQGRFTEGLKGLVAARNLIGSVPRGPDTSSYVERIILETAVLLIRAGMFSAAVIEFERALESLDVSDETKASIEPELELAKRGLEIEVEDTGTTHESTDAVHGVLDLRSLEVFQLRACMRCGQPMVLANESRVARCSNVKCKLEKRR